MSRMFVRFTFGGANLTNRQGPILFCEKLLDHGLTRYYLATANRI